MNTRELVLKAAGIPILGQRQETKKVEWNEESKRVEWPEPEALKETLLPVIEFPIEIIPEPLQAWIVDISYRMQCPVDFVAVATMVMSGSIIGAGCGIRPKKRDDWLVIPNLWGAVIGRPGTLKTPALKEALNPIAIMEADAKEKYEYELKYFEAKKESHKAIKDSIKFEMGAVAKGKSKSGKDIGTLEGELAFLEEPDSPAWKRYKTNDATIEKMGELLEQNERGILLFRDELTGFLVSLDKEGREPDRAFYLESWNGNGSMTCDRVGRGTVHVSNLCISILGGIQPAKLLAYLYQAASELENDGLMQRMQLMVYPDEVANWRLIDEFPNTIAKHKACEVIKKLAEINFKDYVTEKQEGEKIPYFRFDDRAQEAFNAWLTKLHKKLQDDEVPVMLEHLTKYRSLMPSLALVDHLINIADGQISGSVRLESVERAITWCSYLESHARRIYGLLGDISQRAAIELAKKLKAGKIKDGFTLRDVYRNSWHLLSDKETVNTACDELIDMGWLLKEDMPIKGRQPKVIYLINPKIF